MLTTKENIENEGEKGKKKEKGRVRVTVIGEVPQHLCQGAPPTYFGINIKM